MSILRRMATFLSLAIASTPLSLLAQPDTHLSSTTAPFVQTSLPSTPAIRLIASAQAAIQLKPKRFDLFNNLATGFIRRARETGDPNCYDRAAEAVDASLLLSPDNWEASKLRVLVLLGQGNLIAALKNAERLVKTVPDDLMAAVYLTDVHLALGNYEVAEHEAQWTLDLRRGNSAGLLRGASVREAFGDIEGAIDFLTLAMRNIAEVDSDERAGIFTEVARLQLLLGKTENAAANAKQALVIFPGFPSGLRVLSQVLFAQEKYDEAADLLGILIETAPRPEYFYDRAIALDRAGHYEAAVTGFKDFESRAQSILANGTNANRELILYYVDRAGKPAEALRLATREMERQHDLATRDAYAWALYGNGDLPAAKREIEIALAVGSRTPSLCYHAGAIALKNGDNKTASEYLRRAIEANGPEAEPARRMLVKMSDR